MVRSGTGDLGTLDVVVHTVLHRVELAHSTYLHIANDTPSDTFTGRTLASPPPHCVLPLIPTLIPSGSRFGSTFSSQPVTDPFCSRPATSAVVSVLRLLALAISSSFSIFVSSGCLPRLAVERSVLGPEFGVVNGVLFTMDCAQVGCLTAVRLGDLVGLGEGLYFWHFRGFKGV